MLEYPESVLNQMWEQITVIEAQEQLKLMSALDWPNMKKSTREKNHRALFKEAYPSAIREKKYITVQDLQKVVGR